MRITTSMLFSVATTNVNQNKENYLNAQEPLITNKRINRPSDDPVGAARASATRANIARIDQYQRNVGYGRTFITQMESALQSVTEDLQRARELAVDVNGGVGSVQDLQAAADEIGSIFQNVLKNSNARDDRRYIFAGYRTTSIPFDSSGTYSGGVNESIEIEMSENNFVTINMDGEEVFKSPTDVFQVLADLQTAISANDQTQISALIPQVEAALQQVVRAESAIGAISNTIDRAENQNDEMKAMMTQILSNTEDADVAQATSKFTYTEQVYQATLLVSNRMMSMNLLDYIG